MLIIHSLFQAFYGFWKNISKKAYRYCAVIISGTVIVSLISLNSKDFTGSGKNRLSGTEREPGTFETEEEDESTTSITKLSTINSFLLSTVLPEGLKNSVNVQLVELLINQAELRIQKEIPFRNELENKDNRILKESLLANVGLDKKENEAGNEILLAQKTDIRKEESLQEDVQKVLPLANQQADVSQQASIRTVWPLSEVIDAQAVVQAVNANAQDVTPVLEANTQTEQATMVNTQTGTQPQVTDVNAQASQTVIANVQTTLQPQATDVNTQTTVQPQAADVNTQAAQTITANTQPTVQSQPADTNAQIVQGQVIGTVAQNATQAANVNVQTAQTATVNTQTAIQPQTTDVNAQVVPATTQLDTNAQTAQAQNVSTDTQVAQSANVTGVSDEEYEVLSRIVEAEAGGEDMMGKILVANVVINRVNNPKFPNTIKEVVFQKHQFSPISDGRYDSVTVSDDSREAATRALSGEDYSQGALYFSARSQADPGNMSWFDNNLTWLFQYGHHEFYTE